MRVCDGFYFPISTGGGQKKRKIDAEVCQSHYAQAGQAELYLHVPGTDVAEATSASGKQRYSDQRYAFKFQMSYDASCHAQLRTGMAALEQRFHQAPPTTHRAESDSARLANVPLPRMRPRDRGEDPETVALRIGGLVLSARDRTIPGASPTIRFVGDAYYAEFYDPENLERSLQEHRGPLGFDLLGGPLELSPVATTSPLTD